MAIPGPIIPTSDKTVSTYPSRFLVRRKSKILATLDHKCGFVVGRAIMLDRVSKLCHRALIGRFEYYLMNKEEWVAWATLHWKPILTYVPTISLLAKISLVGFRFPR